MEAFALSLLQKAGGLTAEEFETRFGIKPKNDDLERVNCPRVGELGHWMCGICSIHHGPRFACGCTTRSAS